MPINVYQKSITEELNTWKKGQPITTDKLNDISSALHNITQDVYNAINPQEANNESSALGTKLNGIKEQAKDVIQVSENDSDLEDNNDAKVWINTRPEESIVLTTMNDLFGNCTRYEKNMPYEVGQYFYDNETKQVYKVKEKISAANNTSLNNIRKYTQPYIISSKIQNIMKKDEQIVLVKDEITSDEMKNTYPENKIWINPDNAETQAIATVKDLRNIVAEPYQENVQYNIGDVVLYEDENKELHSYQFQAHHDVGESWNNNQVEVINFNSLNNKINEIKQNAVVAQENFIQREEIELINNSNGVKMHTEITFATKNPNKMTRVSGSSYLSAIITLTSSWPYAKKIIVKANEDYSAIIAFFKSVSMQAGGDIQWATGHSKAITINIGTTQTFVIPDDCTKIYLQITDKQSNNRTPENVSFVNIYPFSYIKSKIIDLESRIAALQPQ